MTPRPKPGAAGGYHLAVLARTLLAILGGYAVAGLAAACMPLILPLARVDATVLGMLLSFAIYAGAVVWAYAAGSIRRAAAGILLPVATLGGLLAALLLAGGGPA